MSNDHNCESGIILIVVVTLLSHKSIVQRMCSSSNLDSLSNRFWEESCDAISYKIISLEEKEEEKNKF